ncbi:NnrU family protein [Sphingorhabdus sp. Alg239-R122]|uniref:NnrU family protein n=1 Tax=Sphingorhabdus sp. Alg239-R122 TaxID=2305989 RepID=UPI0013DBAFDA|nr:NnrU family protein [Sphingorhabdus sp. Alg239-R122]
MTPVLSVLGAWLLFGGSHLLLSGTPLRTYLADRVGSERFLGLYALIAAFSLSLLGVTAILHGGSGMAGLAWGKHPVGWLVLGSASFLGMVLMLLGLMDYAKSAMAVLGRRMRLQGAALHKPLAGPKGISRVTRHPFFTGLAIWAGAHALISSTLATSVYFAGFSLLSVIGLVMQDSKLRHRHGDVYKAHLGRTSALPDARAIVWHEIAKQAAIAVLAAIMIGNLHIIWQPGHGGYFAFLVAMGGTMAVIRQVRKAP